MDRSNFACLLEETVGEYSGLAALQAWDVVAVVSFNAVRDKYLCVY